MKEQLALLVKLQTMDLKRQKDKDLLKSFPEKMVIAEKPLNDVRAEIAASQTQLEQREKDRKEAELDLQVIEEKIVKLKLRLTELKTNKEYHAHLQEIAAARSTKSDLEDQLLTAMEDIDQLQTDTVAKQEQLTKDESAFSGVKKEMQDEMDQIASQAAIVEADWQATSEKISKNLLGSYQRLFNSCKGLAVVPVNGSTCTGCHFSLPPQLITEVKMQSKVLTCDYCHRILYVKPSEVPAE